MIILIYYLLLGYTIVSSIKSQWLSSDSFQSRLSFPCTNGTFNCGNGVCISLNKIQDEVIDCFDGSDEFCFPGYIKCGSKCVEFIYAGDCLKHPDCDDPIQSPPFCAYLKKKLCAFNDTIKCRGYGECIEKAWLFDNKQDCYDGSDLDPTYISIFENLDKKKYPKELLFHFQSATPAPFILFNPFLQTTTICPPYTSQMSNPELSPHNQKIVPYFNKKLIPILPPDGLDYMSVQNTTLVPSKQFPTLIPSSALIEYSNINELHTINASSIIMPKSDNNLHEDSENNYNAYATPKVNTDSYDKSQEYLKTTLTQTHTIGKTTNSHVSMTTMKATTQDPEIIMTSGYYQEVNEKDKYDSFNVVPVTTRLLETTSKYLISSKFNGPTLSPKTNGDISEYELTTLKSILQTKNSLKDLLNNYKLGIIPSIEDFKNGNNIPYNKQSNLQSTENELRNIKLTTTSKFLVNDLLSTKSTTPEVFEEYVDFSKPPFISTVMPNLVTHSKDIFQKVADKSFDITTNSPLIEPNANLFLVTKGEIETNTRFFITNPPNPFYVSTYELTTLSTTSPQTSENEKVLVSNFQNEGSLSKSPIASQLSFPFLSANPPSIYNEKVANFNPIENIYTTADSLSKNKFTTKEVTSNTNNEIGKDGNTLGWTEITTQSFEKNVFEKNGKHDKSFSGVDENILFKSTSKPFSVQQKNNAESDLFQEVWSDNRTKEPSPNSTKDSIINANSLTGGMGLVPLVNKAINSGNVHTTIKPNKSGTESSVELNKVATIFPLEENTLFNSADKIFATTSSMPTSIPVKNNLYTTFLPIETSQATLLASVNLLPTESTGISDEQIAHLFKKCIHKVMLDNFKRLDYVGDPTCECDPGESPGLLGICRRDPNLIPVKLTVKQICQNRVTDEVKRQLAQAISSLLIHGSHVDHACFRLSKDKEWVGDIFCENCSIKDVFQVINKDTFNATYYLEEGSKEACDNKDLNYCDKSAICMPQNYSYTCICQNGTTPDEEEGGRNCHGAFECGQFLGICLLYWILIIPIIFILIPFLIYMLYLCLQHFGCCAGYFSKQKETNEKLKNRRKSRVIEDIKEAQKWHPADTRPSSVHSTDDVFIEHRRNSIRMGKISNKSSVHSLTDDKIMDVTNYDLERNIIKTVADVHPVPTFVDHKKQPNSLKIVNETKKGFDSENIEIATKAAAVIDTEAATLHSVVNKPMDTSFTVSSEVTYLKDPSGPLKSDSVLSTDETTLSRKASLTSLSTIKEVSDLEEKNVFFLSKSTKYQKFGNSPRAFYKETETTESIKSEPFVRTEGLEESMEIGRPSVSASTSKVPLHVRNTSKASLLSNDNVTDREFGERRDSDRISVESNKNREFTDTSVADDMTKTSIYDTSLTHQTSSYGSSLAHVSMQSKLHEETIWEHFIQVADNLIDEEENKEDSLEDLFEARKTAISTIQGTPVPQAYAPESSFQLVNTRSEIVEITEKIPTEDVSRQIIKDPLIKLKDRDISSAGIPQRKKEDIFEASKSFDIPESSMALEGNRLLSESKIYRSSESMLIEEQEIEDILREITKITEYDTDQEQFNKAERESQSLEMLIKEQIDKEDHFSQPPNYELSQIREITPKSRAVDSVIVAQSSIKTEHPLGIIKTEVMVPSSSRLSRNNTGMSGGSERSVKIKIVNNNIRKAPPNLTQRNDHGNVTRKRDQSSRLAPPTINKTPERSFSDRNKAQSFKLPSPKPVEITVVRNQGKSITKTINSAEHPVEVTILNRPTVKKPLITTSNSKYITSIQIDPDQGTFKLPPVNLQIPKRPLLPKSASLSPIRHPNPKKIILNEPVKRTLLPKIYSKPPLPKFSNKPSQFPLTPMESNIEAKQLISNIFSRPKLESIIPKENNKFKKTLQPKPESEKKYEPKKLPPISINKPNVRTMLEESEIMEKEDDYCDNCLEHELHSIPGITVKQDNHLNLPGQNVKNTTPKTTTTSFKKKRQLSSISEKSDEYRSQHSNRTHEDIKSPEPSDILYSSHGSSFELIRENSKIPLNFDNTITGPPRSARDNIINLMTEGDFYVGDVDLDLPGPFMVPISESNLHQKHFLDRKSAVQAQTGLPLLNWEMHSARYKDNSMPTTGRIFENEHAWLSRKALANSEFKMKIGNNKVSKVYRSEPSLKHETRTFSRKNEIDRVDRRISYNNDNYPTNTFKRSRSSMSIEKRIFNNDRQLSQTKFEIDRNINKKIWDISPLKNGDINEIPLPPLSYTYQAIHKNISR